VISIYANGANTGYIVTGSYHIAFRGIEPVVGDVDGDVNRSIVRGLLEFPIDTIPAGSTLTDAKLLLTQCKVAGKPFTKLGNVVVEHITYGDPFDTSAFDSPRIGAAVGMLSDNPSLGKRTLVITPVVQADLAAGRKLSQYRLRMSLFDGNADSVSDYVAFHTENYRSHICPGANGVNPLLIVTYH
jgi:hypothetical protein